MRRLALLSGILVLLTFTVSRVSVAQTPSTTQINPFDTPVQDIERDIARWDRDANIQIAFVIAIFSFGAFVAAFQGSDKRWCKVVTLVLGVATSILTVINAQVFPADYRAYKTAVTQGRAVVKRLEVMNATFAQKPPTGADLVIFRKEFDDKVESFNDIASKLVGPTTSTVSPTGPNSSGSGSSASSSGEMQLLRRVYAQAQAAPEAPSWVQNLPSDNRNFYFLGKGSQSLLTEAKTDSFNDAIKQASAALAPSEIYADSLVRDAAVVQDTFITVDRNSSKYVYYTLLRISRGSLHPSPWMYVQKDWRPVAMAYNSMSGLFVFDDSGIVSQVRVGQTGIQIQELFRLKGSDRPADLTADSQSVFATSNNTLGCTIYQYSLAKKKTVQKLIALTGSQRGCDGIAADNGALFVVLAGKKEIRYWPRWGSSAYEGWDFNEINPLGGVLALDKESSRLIYADQLGTAFGISLPDKKIQALTSNVGAVHAIAKSPSQILLASGTKLLFYSKKGFQGENPPASMKSLTGGVISGIAVDSSNSAWVADFDKGIIEGPLPLSSVATLGLPTKNKAR